MAREDIERAIAADRRAAIEAARHLLDAVEAQLAERRLQRASAPRIVFKTNENALVRPPQKLHYTDYGRFR